MVKPTISNMAQFSSVRTKYMTSTYTWHVAEGIPQYDCEKDYLCEKDYKIKHSYNNSFIILLLAKECTVNHLSANESQPHSIWLWSTCLLYLSWEIFVCLVWKASTFCWILWTLYCLCFNLSEIWLRFIKREYRYHYLWNMLCYL